jgi:hypothetical protein
LRRLVRGLGIRSGCMMRLNEHKKHEREEKKNI